MITGQVSSTLLIIRLIYKIFRQKRLHSQPFSIHPYTKSDVLFSESDICDIQLQAWIEFHH